MTILKDQFERPLRDLRISVTDRCNFRCSYCMPEEIFGEKYQFLRRQQLLTFEEITRLTRIIVGAGAVKLRITGGEPLVRQEIETLIEMLVQIEGVHDIAMTTNAYLLPQKAEALKKAGLERITVSLDSLDDDVFRQMNGNKSGVAEVLHGIEVAQKVGFAPIKINTVVKRGVNDHTLVDLARYCKDRGYIIRFIEYMDVGTINGWEMEHVVPAREIVERIDAVFPLEPIDPNYKGEVAKRYRYQDGSGEIGVITSVTQPFCGACSRIRLSSDGKLFTCLFGVKGTDVRTALRDGSSDEAIHALIAKTWGKRTDRYSELRTKMTKPLPKVEMYHIGG